MKTGIIISLRVLTWGSSRDGSHCTAQLPTAGEKPPSLRKGWREDLSFMAVASSSPSPTPPQTGHLFLVPNWSSCSQKQDELDRGTLSSQGPRWAVWAAGRPAAGLRQEPCPQTTHLSPACKPACLHCLTPSALCSLHLGRLLCLHLSWQQDRVNWPGERFIASFLFPQAGVGKLLPNSSQSLLGDGPWAKNRFYIFKGLEKLFKKMKKLATETLCSRQNLKHLLSGPFHKHLPSLPQREVSRANGISAFVLAGTRPPASSKSFSCSYGWGEGNRVISRNNSMIVEKIFSFLHAENITGL